MVGRRHAEMDRVNFLPFYAEHRHHLVAHERRIRDDGIAALQHRRQVLFQKADAQFWVRLRKAYERQVVHSVDDGAGEVERQVVRIVEQIAAELAHPAAELQPLHRAKHLVRIRHHALHELLRADDAGHWRIAQFASPAMTVEVVEVEVTAAVDRAHEVLRVLPDAGER